MILRFLSSSSFSPTDTVRQQVSPNALVICGVSKIDSLATNYELLVIATEAKFKVLKPKISR